MKTGTLRIGGTSYPVYSLNTLVVGSGAAGLNAAVRLWREGQRDIAVVTDKLGGGASFNSGSDKQTYYKISLAGDLPDSSRDMAADLFAGGCMAGDLALAEAQGSAEAFFHLVDLGVPFPFDRFGAYVGYKTDHDPRQRATSAGPLTSRLMGERLAGRARELGIPVIDRHRVIKLLTAGPSGRKRVVGATALDLGRSGTSDMGFVLFNAVNVVLATGGPGGMYAHTVYPEDQPGSHGLAIEAGATARNLTESQYGLASVGFRWNLSGTYQQAVPRYFSTDAAGRDEREFLNDVFPDMGRLASAVFLKGYQWPFDPRKVAGYGSSLVDLLVYRETVERGRRVFLDYRRNPSGAGKLRDFRLRQLVPEAYGFLERSGALQKTPIARLLRMNRPAVDLFRSHGIDLAREPLEAAVCAQHNNGGFKVNVWWESDLRHLFPVGEAAGTHGVYRPGGSALNAGQVGGLRAARFIAARYGEKPPAVREFGRAAGGQIRKTIEQAAGMIDPGAGRAARLLDEAMGEVRERMSACGAHIRRPEAVGREAPLAWALWKRLRRELRVARAETLPRAFSVLGEVLTHAVYLEAIAEHMRKGGQSRGSYLIPREGGEAACPGLDEAWRFSLAGPGDFVSRKILELRLDGRGRLRKSWAEVGRVPAAGGWFETVWNDFREGRTIREDT